MMRTEPRADLIDRYDMLPEGSRVLCAVSGGADSMCLLHWLYELQQGRGFQLAAAHYEHGIRGAESLRDAEFTAEQCRKLGELERAVDSASASEAAMYRPLPQSRRSAWRKRQGFCATAFWRRPRTGSAATGSPRPTIRMTMPRPC